MTEADAPRATSRDGDRTVLVAGIGLATVAVLAVIAIAAFGSRDPAALPEGSPEQAMQRYLAAFEDRDYEAAYGWFSAAVRDELTVTEYERSVREFAAYERPSRRILTERSTIDGDRAVVVLIVEEFYDDVGPFGGGEIARSTREIRLVQEDGAWRIADPLVWLDPLPTFRFEQ